MRRFFDLDEAVNELYLGDDVDRWPDAWKNVRKEGRWITKLTWYADDGDGADYDYIDADDWAELACGYFKSYGMEAKIVKDGIIVHD